MTTLLLCMSFKYTHYDHVGCVRCGLMLACMTVLASMTDCIVRRETHNIHITLQGSMLYSNMSTVLQFCHQLMQDMASKIESALRIVESTLKINVVMLASQQHASQTWALLD